MRSFTRLSVFSAPILGSIILLSGCATLSKEECTVGNWQTIGYNDGVAGYYSDRLAAHAKACAKVGTAPDYQTWERGRQRGLQQYCTVSNTNVLQQANQQGQRYYNLNKQLTEDKRLLEKYQAEYSKLRDGEMLDFSNEKNARARLLSLPPELQRLKYRIATTEAKLAVENQKTHF